jgi:hypothetical protein
LDLTSQRRISDGRVTVMTEDKRQGNTPEWVQA